MYRYRTMNVAAIIVAMNRANNVGKSSEIVKLYWSIRTIKLPLSVDFHAAEKEEEEEEERRLTSGR